MRTSRITMTTAVALAAALGGQAQAAEQLQKQSQSQAQSQSLLELPKRRQGYFLSLSLEGGVSYHRDDGKSLGAWGGSGYVLRLGEMLTRHLGMAIAVNAASGK